MAPRLIANDIRELLPMRRAPGDHVSSIIHALCVKMGRFDDNGGDPNQFMFEVGSAFEDAIARALAARYERDNPGRYIHGFEMTVDGVSGNLDLFDTEDFVPEEIKLTKMSIRHDIEGEKFWPYWAQLKSYAYMIGAHTGRLHVGFVNGNYKYDYDDPDAGWQYRVWEDTWSKKQLADHWRMVVGHKGR